MAEQTGLLAVWTDIAPEKELEFYQWYDDEHLPERADNAGFLNARRYRLIEEDLKWGEPPRTFAAYDTESLAALGAPDYVNALGNQTEWSNSLFPYFRNTNRMIAGMAGDAGRGYGGAMLARFAPVNEMQVAALRGQLNAGLMDQICKEHGIVRASLALGVLAALGSDAVANMEAARDAPTHAALLVEADNDEALTLLCSVWMAGQDLPPLTNDAPGMVGGIYMLRRGVLA